MIFTSRFLRLYEIYFYFMKTVYLHIPLLITHIPWKENSLFPPADCELVFLTFIHYIAKKYSCSFDLAGFQ